jgi:hypothetical protein
MDQAFINETSIMSVSGCVTLITFGVNAIANISNKVNPKYLGLSLSLFIAVLNVSVAKDATFLTWVLAPLNALMLYSMAFGLNSSLLTTRTDTHGVLPDEQQISTSIENIGLLPRLAAFFGVRPW